MCPAFNYRDALGCACVCTRKYATQQATCPCTAGRGKRASACVRARFRKWVGHAGLHAEGESIDVRCILPLFLPFSAIPRTPFSLTTDDSTFARKRPLLDVQLLFSCTSFMLFPLKGCNSPRFFFFFFFVFLRRIFFFERIRYIALSRKKFFSS